MGSKFSYFIKDVFKGIWRNRLMTLASLFVLVSCMLIMGTSIVVSFNINGVADKIENENEIVVFLKDDITQDQLSSIEKMIDEDQRLVDKVYFSKEQALQEFVEQRGGDTSLYQSLQDDNVLPASFRITFKNDGNISQSVSNLEKAPGVEKIRFNKNLADKIANFSRIINIVGIWLIAVLAVVSLFIIQNTIKITLFTRKKEINIMKYVGATDAFIETPFVLEGVFIGLLSCGIAYALEYVLYNRVITKIIGGFGLDIIQAVPFGEMWAYILLPFVLTGLVVGGLGSLMSIRKYLKV